MSAVYRAPITSILRAVDPGGDTDTIAAIAGSLAGLCYGEAAIPEKRRKSMFRLDEIEALCARFAEAFSRDR